MKTLIRIWIVAGIACTFTFPAQAQWCDDEYCYEDCDLITDEYGEEREECYETCTCLVWGEEVEEEDCWEDVVEELETCAVDMLTCGIVCTIEPTPICETVCVVQAGLCSIVFTTLTVWNC